MKGARTGTTANGRDLRQHILQCVVKLVGTHGFAKVRLRDVATEAEVSIGSLQHYFDTRNILMRQAFIFQGERVISELEAAATAGTSPWHRIEALVSYATTSDEFPQRSQVWLEFSAASSRDPDLRRVMERVYDGWRAPLREAIEGGRNDGTFQPVMSTEDVVDTILTLIDGFELATGSHIPGFDGTRARDVVLTTAAAILGHTG